VKAETPLVEPDKTSISTAVDPRFMQNLPLQDRQLAGNFIEYALKRGLYPPPGSSSFGRGTIQNAITYPGTGSDVSATR